VLSTGFAAQQAADTRTIKSTPAPFTVQIFEYAPRTTNSLLLSYYSGANIVKAQLKKNLLGASD
jgi:hypothetical protein